MNSATLKRWLLLSLLVMGGVRASGVPADIAISPDPPIAMQPFMLSATVEANEGAIGFGWNIHEISGNTIVAHFDTGCGILCPPGQNIPVRDAIALPGLPEGMYTAIVMLDGSTELGRISFVVAADTHVPIPFAQPWTWAVIVAAMALSGLWVTRRRATHP